MAERFLTGRGRFGVVIPMTNVAVEADYTRFALEGVSFHYGRASFTVPEFATDDMFDKLQQSIHDGSELAIEQIISSKPDYMICGMSAETFWGGVEGNRSFTERVKNLSGGLGVTTGAGATADALTQYGAKRIAFLCPYPTIGVDNVSRFYTESGFEVVDSHGFACETPHAMWDLDDDDFRPIVNRFLDQEVDAIVQLGSNVAMVEYAAAVERHTKVPVIPINGACIWQAYRALGINDQFGGRGRLFEDL